MEWKEEDHPRAEDGKFTDGQTEHSSGNKKPNKKEQLHKLIEQRKKSFINIYLFQAKDYSNWEGSKMEKSIRSLNKRISEHEYKIAHPDEFYSDWDTCSEEVKIGRIGHWEHELKIFQIDIERINKEIKKRGNK